MTEQIEFKELNDQQREAVNCSQGNKLILAGAGSGKTKALTHRIAHLISDFKVDPAEILAVTFTNKAAREMKDRLEILLAKKLAENDLGQPLNTLHLSVQNELRTRIYKEVTKDLWICLLYTSPSPRDRQKSRMPSSA